MKTEIISTTGSRQSGPIPDSAAEKRRKALIRSIFAIYWLLIFEGAIKKWIAPHYTRELYFIKDPFLLWTYWLAVSGRMRPLRSKFLIIGLVFGVVCVGRVLV